MSEPGPVKVVKATVSTVGEVIKIAADNPDARAAGGQAAKAVLTVTKAINNALLPLAAVNFAIDKFRDYFETKFNSDLGEKLKNVPKESIVAPKASIAGPAMQRLAFSYEEPDLKELYLSLLASAMDGRVSEDAHPAFVEIIGQLTAEEAPFLREILSYGSGIPIAEIRLNLPNPKGFITLYRHLLNLGDDGRAVEKPRLPALVDNWIRLGLVVVDYDRHLADESAYEWVESRPELARLKIEHETEESKISIAKGILSQTAFGILFAAAVGIVDRVIPT